MLVKSPLYGDVGEKPMMRMFDPFLDVSEKPMIRMFDPFLDVSEKPIIWGCR
jgi:hypothetical protein